MDFHWQKYDEGHDELVCHYQKMSAYVYRSLLLNKWIWFIRDGEATYEGQTTCTADAFIAAEDKMRSLLHKTIIISHKGNLTGPKTAKFGENNPASIQHALSLGFHAEVDVWWNNGWFLGHDQGEYPVSLDFLHNAQLYVHCKNIAAMIEARPDPRINAFFHQKDDITILSNSMQVWHYPNAKNALGPNSIAVMPELVGEWPGIDKCYGICTDSPIEYQKKYA